MPWPVALGGDGTVHSLRCPSDVKSPQFFIQAEAVRCAGQQTEAKPYRSRSAATRFWAVVALKWLVSDEN